MRAAVLLSLSLCALAPAARAGELGYWQPGILGLRETLVPPQGLYARLEYTGYRGRFFRDREGRRLIDGIVDLPVLGETQLSLEVELELTQVRPALVLVPLDLTLPGLVGLRYGLQVAPSLSNGVLNPSLTRAGRFVRRRTRETELGLGDLLLQPVWIGVRLWRLELAASYSVYLATGDYQSAEESGGETNRSNGFACHQLQGTAALSLDPLQMGALVGRLTWELPEQQEDTRLEPGARVTIELGYSQDLVEYKGVVFGVGGSWSHQRQLDPDGPERRVLNRPNRGRDQISAVSVELIGKYLPYGLLGTFVATYELSGEARLEGLRLALNVSFALPPLQKAPPRRE